MDVVFANRPDPNTPMEGTPTLVSTLSFIAFESSPIVSFPSHTLNHVFLMFCPIAHNKTAPLFCLYGYCNTKTQIYKPLVTEMSIFKCCVLSWCFHLHSQNEDRYWCWRPLNGRVLTVCGLSWSHSMHLLPCQSSPFGLEFGQRSSSCLQLMLHWLRLAHNTLVSC